MTRPIFIFIATLHLLAPVFLAFEHISLLAQVAICMPIILLLGIPHGAIDNVLYITGKKLNIGRFITIYLLTILLNVLLWVIKPELAYISFLLLSAYHFGQSQFSHYLDNKQPLNKVFFGMWGIAILSGLIFFNLDEINQIMLQYADFKVLQSVHNLQFIQYIFGVSTIYTVAALTYFAISGRLKAEPMIIELLLMGGVFFCFFTMPLLIGFTLFFVILHSLKVLREEYSFLALEHKRFQLKDFMKLIAPFTLLSFLGIGFVFTLIALDVLRFSYGYVFLITISSITLPHAFVMNNFYNVLSKRGISKQMVA